MRNRPARLIGYLTALVLALGLGGPVGSLVAGGQSSAGTQVIADDKGPLTPTP
ncbi:hypothetical protein [Streptomyces sp. NPDC056600]|uniref:hypothetical protein n=1 Tax=Streptomyces sp. NPDC056600 TaxID=3345874 RepID=UPI0036CC37F2